VISLLILTVGGLVLIGYLLREERALRDLDYFMRHMGTDPNDRPTE
jgi:hypothetical protein